jgi:Putative peptidoglycan binding domain
MRIKRPALLAFSALFAAATAADAQNASPNPTGPIQKNAKPARKHVPVRPTAIPHPATQRTPAHATGLNAPNRSRHVHVTYAEAVRRYHHQRHDRFWWKRHYVIVLAGGGYYYWDAGYWYPAWGYDTAYENYDYDGPIYTYGNLLPDQVIMNVQRALKNLGYYDGEINGSLSPASRRALSAFQEDNGLEVTGAIDEATVYALGLI